MTKDMTQGRPLKLILLFMLPLLIGNLFQQFYNMADAFIVGRTIGVDALAAVGSTGALMFLILGFATGLTSGMAIITAQRFGAKDEAGVRRSFSTSIIIALAATVLLTFASVVFTRPLLQLLRTPADIFEDAYRYSIVVFWGIAAAMLFNLFSSVMRAVGDSRSPLVFLVIACLLNIGLDYALILVFNMGVAGAAVATVAAQLVAGGLCLFYIFKKLPALRLAPQNWRPSRQDMREHLRLGLPMAFQTSIIAIGAVVLQFALNSLGTDAVAAFTAAQKIDSFPIMLLSSFGITMATYTAQNYGAGKIQRIFKGVLQCAGVSVSSAFLFALINVLFGHQLAGIFIADSPKVAAMAHEYLIINGAFYFILALLFIFRYTLQGLGQSFIPTLAGVMELIMRCLAAIFFTRFWGFTGASFAGPLAWFGSCVPLTIAFFATMYRLRAQAKQRLPMAPQASFETAPALEHPSPKDLL